MTSRSLPALGLSVLLATSASAQDATYHIEPGDTLRYVESSTWRTIIRGGNDVPASLVRDATISVAAVEPGLWHAEYVSFDVRSIRVGGMVAPDREFLMGRPFVLRVSALGDVVLEEPPTILPVFSDLYDPTCQFVDFFVSIPRAELSIHDTWADTVGSTEAPERGSAVQVIRNFRVVGDTLVDDAEALVIEVQSDVEFQSTLPVPGWTGPARTFARGSEHGRVIYSPSSRTLLSRTRSGTLAGTLVTGSNSVPINIQYDGELYRSRQMRSN